MSGSTPAAGGDQRAGSVVGCAKALLSYGPISTTGRGDALG